MIIGIAGAIGSGKSTLAKALGAAVGAKSFSFGDYVRFRASETKISAPTRRELQDLGHALVEADPNDFAAGVLSWIGYLPNTTMIVDGVRHIAVWEAVVRCVAPEPALLIYLRVDRDERLRRAAARGLSANDLAEWDAHPTERDLPALQSAAKLVIESRATIDATIQKALTELAIFIERP